MTLGWLYFGADWDWKAARAEFERARAIDPDNQWVARGLARINNSIYGRIDEETKLHREELVRNPLDLSQLEQLAAGQLVSGQLQESAATFRNLLQSDPNYVAAYAGLSAAHMYMGRLDDALVEANKESDEMSRLAATAIIYWAQHRKPESDAALKLCVERYGQFAYMQIAEIYAYRGETDAAFQWLDRAYREHDNGVVNIRSDPLLRNLHQDPRYQAFLVPMKLADG